MITKQSLEMKDDYNSGKNLPQKNRDMNVSGPTTPKKEKILKEKWILRNSHLN